MIEIRWHGRGGQGAFTAAKILGSAVSLNEDKFAMSFPSFGPERRGAPIQAFTKIDSCQITNRSKITSCDYIVFLDETLFDLNNLHNLHDLKEGGKIILNSDSSEKYKGIKNILTIDAKKIAMEILKVPITNTAMLGALIGISNIASLSSVHASIGDYLPSKVTDKNIEVLNRAFSEVKNYE